ncbi:MAG: SLC13 family permease [Candidatus Thorarchaeota archaeon]|jgi:Na+/H+ antiporter NhaD/arsenite permease-like protein
MKKPGVEVVATVLVAAMSAIAIILAVVFQEMAMAVLVVFIGTYAMISSERVNRTAMALLGLAIAGVVLWLGFELGLSHGADFNELIEHIEWTTIIFVIAMFVIVSVAAASGLFQYIALRIAKPSGGDHKALFTTFMVFVAAISLFFDTVSTMLIIAPLTIEICNALEIDFKPFLVSEAIVCNFSSIPSVVGAIPNLVIAGETKLDVGFLFITLMPLSIILFLVSLLIMLRWYGSTFGTTDEYRIDTVLSIDPASMIKDKWDFNVSVIAIIFLVIGFALGPTFGVVPPMIALLVAAFMLLVAHEKANDFFNRVGWPTVFFLVGLFGLVVALELTGLIDAFGLLVGEIVGDSAAFATVFLVWIPAMLSAFLDNLPVSVVLAPIARDFAVISPVIPLALVFAVNIGGYIFTPLGSPANMVVIGLSEAAHNPIAFIDFVKIGTLLGLIHLVIGSGYLLFIMFLLGG